MPHLLTPVVDDARLSGPQPDIAAGDLMLRRWSRRDTVHLIAAFRDPDIRAWHLRTLDSQAEAGEWMMHWKRRWRRHAGASWAVSPARNRETVLGQVAFRSLYPADGLAECSYWVMPSWRRRGIATQAVTALANWALDDIGLERIELVHSTENQPSCRVAVGARFQLEGTMRHLQRHADGWHDMHLHSRVRSTELPPGSGMPPRFRLARLLRPLRAAASGPSEGCPRVSVGEEGGGGSYR